MTEYFGIPHSIAGAWAGSSTVAAVAGFTTVAAISGRYWIRFSYAILHIGKSNRP